MITVDDWFLGQKRLQYCIACGKAPNPKNHAHHVWPKGMGHGKGGDDFFNVLTLCGDCHVAAPYAWHRNLPEFFERFPHVWAFLDLMGWERIDKGYKITLVHPAYRDQKWGEPINWKIPEEKIKQYLK